MGWLKVPNDLVDVWLPGLTGAELKVWLFGRRQTVGFNKEYATLSSEQICAGIEKRTGERLNHGTGLSRRTVFQALKGLESKGLATRTPRRGTTNIYTFDVPQPVQKDERVPVQKGEQVESDEPVHSGAQGSAKTEPGPVHSGAPTKDIVGQNPSKDTRTAESKNPSRPTNGRYAPTMDDARAFNQLMFTATNKTEKLETALSWLRLARRAKGWTDIERALRDKLARNPPRNNAWFRKVLENEYGLSPDDKDSIVEELKQRYLNAVRLPPEQRSVECMRLLEEAESHGIRPTVLMGVIG